MGESVKGYKSGSIAIVGRPNVGKSTLFNLLVGEKIAAVTDKPQTTRHRILGIKTTLAGQMIFVDTPGIHQPHKKLNEYMMEIARAVFDEVDLFLFLIEPADRLSEQDRSIYEAISARKKPVLLILNKVDRVAKEKLLPLIALLQNEWTPDAIIPVAATREKYREALENEILKRLPSGPPLYPEDQLSDLPERFIVSEMIREKLMDFTRKEIPYASTVQIETFEEPTGSKKIIKIRASIIVERESQKGIVIGKGGAMIKRIGQESRKQIEAFLGKPVFLELFVRVEKEWTKDPKKVREFAYS